jgi:hypothetical protein
MCLLLNLWEEKTMIVELSIIPIGVGTSLSE